MEGFRLTATDTAWSVGSGLPVEGPIAALLLLVTGRDVALDRLDGEGAHRLAAARRRRDGTPRRPA